MGHSDISLADYDSIWEECIKEIDFSVTQHRYTRTSLMNIKERLDGKEKSFTYSQKLLAYGFKKANKLEKLCQKLYLGYMVSLL